MSGHLVAMRSPRRVNIEPFRVEISQAALDAERRQAMSYSTSTLLTRMTSSVKATPRVGARPSTRSSPKIACSTSPGVSTVAATRSIASRARSRLYCRRLSLFRQATLSWTLPCDVLCAGLATAGGIFRGRPSYLARGLAEVVLAVELRSNPSDPITTFVLRRH